MSELEWEQLKALRDAQSTDVNTRVRALELALVEMQGFVSKAHHKATGARASSDVVSEGCRAASEKTQKALQALVVSNTELHERGKAQRKEIEALAATLKEERENKWKSKSHIIAIVGVLISCAGVGMAIVSLLR